MHPTSSLFITTPAPHLPSIPIASLSSVTFSRVARRRRTGGGSFWVWLSSSGETLALSRRGLLCYTRTHVLTHIHRCTHTCIHAYMHTIKTTCCMSSPHSSFNENSFRDLRAAATALGRALAGKGESRMQQAAGLFLFCTALFSETSPTPYPERTRHLPQIPGK